MDVPQANPGIAKGQSHVRLEQLHTVECRLLLRIVSEPFVGTSGLQQASAIILTLAAVLHWLGCMVFVYLAWGRVKVK
jgi:hypothetical protein